MRVLFIGGTGNISSDCVLDGLSRGWEIYLLNRGNRTDRMPDGVHLLKADARKKEEVLGAIGDLEFDAVANFIIFTPEQIARDIEIFADRTRHYLFISSASVYHKPLTYHVITESTPAYNPFWEYSQKKIACERLLQGAYETKGFPATIVRPSHTYSTGWLISSFGHDFTTAERMLSGKEVVVHGDGETLWTLTHTKDFAVGFNGLVGNPAAIGETFHITSDFIYTWNAIHRALARELGVEAKIVHIPSDVIAHVAPEEGPAFLGDKAHCLIFDNTKIRRFVPGFQPHISYPEAIRLTLAWYKEHPELKKFDSQRDAFIDRLLGIWRT